MPAFSNSTLRLLQRLLSRSSHTPTDTSIKTVLDGNTAVAAVEACISEAAGLGASFPADSADFAWQAEQDYKGTNCFGDALIHRKTESARGALSAAIGLSMSGTRATTFLSSPDIMTAQDLLAIAVGKHLPLVVHLTNRTLAGHAGALGSGHKAYHVSTDSGFFVLQATTVQEAVDFTLIARRVAELTLIPGMVAMDGEQIALAAQDVSLPHPHLVTEFLGKPDDDIAVPTESQKFLFGDTRRRVPCWHDPDRPVMHGAVQGPESWTLGAVSKSPYFHDHLEAILEEAFALLSKLTGRTLSPISTYETEKADILLIAQGSAIETLEVVADYMRKTQKIKVGVLGVHGFRPFPAAKIVEHLKNKTVVAVLERLDTPLAADPPLLRQVRASMERALENGRLQNHSNYPVLTDKQLPRFRSVVYGLGGHALRAADLISLCQDLEEKCRGRIFLGVEFDRTSSLYPKRQVLLDNLRRSYPKITRMGQRSHEVSPDLRPAGAFTVAIHNFSEYNGKGLCVEAAAFIHRLNGGAIRSRPALSRESWISGWVDHFTYAPTTLRDPGDDVPIDVIVLMSPDRVTQALSGLRQNSIILAVSPLEHAALWQSLSPVLRKEITEKQISLYNVPTEQSFGGLLGTLLATGLLDAKERKVIKEYEEGATTEQIAQFKAGIEAVALIDYQSLSAESSQISALWNDIAPMAVRHLGHSGQGYDSLPRFWDQVGVLYRNNDTAEMIPGPYMATGIIPPLTSTFRDLTGARDILPAFDPKMCTGCGQCWTRCPESAIASVVIKPKTLLETGIGLANAEPLRMAVGKLATRIHNLGREQDNIYDTAGAFIQDAFTGLKDKLPLSDERKQAMSEAVETVIQKIGDLPVARTQAFFSDPEHFQHETGEFLSVVINPDACKACGLCIGACEPAALTAVSQSIENVELAHKTWQMWEQCPDTSGPTIAHASTHPDIGQMPAILLSRYCQMALAGGDNAEAGSGEKAAIRLALAVTEFQRQPIMSRFIEEIASLRTQLTQTIQESLSRALPTDDLEQLSKGLNAIQHNAPLSSLTQQLEQVAEDGLIDAVRLRRLVKISQALSDLHWRLSEGGHGLGRSRVSLAIAPGTLTQWAGSWPDNPFQVPVAVDMIGETAQLAAGLLEGQMRQAIKGITLIRQARLEVEKPDEAARESKVLTWSDLSLDEQQLCPPLLLLGNDDVLSGKGLAGVTQLLSGSLPVKIMLLADLDMTLGTANVAGTPMAVPTESKIDPALLALSQRKAYIVQTSLAHSSHFLENVKAAFKFSGPALISIHAPSPERHGFAPDQTFKQAQQAITSRVFPLFRYDPDVQGVFGSRISLEGNAELEKSWNTLTPADWAATEQRFAPYFSELSSDAPSPLPILDYLQLDIKTRQRKTPFVTMGEKLTEKRLQVKPALIAVCDERQQSWRTLQELAGLVTPFTADVKRKLQEDMVEAHQSELAALKQEYDVRLENQRAEMETEMATRVKGQLMELAGY